MWHGLLRNASGLDTGWHGGDIGVEKRDAESPYSRPLAVNIQRAGISFRKKGLDLSPSYRLDWTMRGKYSRCGA